MLESKRVVGGEDGQNFQELYEEQLVCLWVAFRRLISSLTYLIQKLPSPPYNTYCQKPDIPKSAVAHIVRKE